MSYSACDFMDDVVQKCTYLGIVPESAIAACGEDSDKVGAVIDAAIFKLHSDRAALLAALEACAEFAIAGRTMPDDAGDRCEWYANQFIKIRAAAKTARAQVDAADTAKS